MTEGVVPAILVEGTVLDGADRVLPLIARPEVGALDYATAGKTEQAGVNVGQFLCKILAQAILVTLPSIFGEERYVLEVASCRRVEEYAQLALGHRGLGVSVTVYFFHSPPLMSIFSEAMA